MEENQELYLDKMTNNHEEKEKEDKEDKEDKEEKEENVGQKEEEVSIPKEKQIDNKTNDIDSINNRIINYKVDENLKANKNANFSMKKITDASQIKFSDPLELLEHAHGAYIKQKVEMYEIVTGCETKNRYTICLRLKNWNKLYKTFKCKEESSWCMRNCCSGEGREFKMLIKYSPNGINDKGDDYSSHCFAELDRPYKCTCCNLNRPELGVHLTNEKKHLGTITEPFSCSRVLINASDGNGDLIYKFDIDRSQQGIACRAFTCGAIESVDFPIIKVDKNGETEVDGEIKRMGRSYDEAVIGSDADCYDIVFPKTATPQEKFLILSTTMLIDFRFFEDTEEEESTVRRRSYYAK